MKRVYLIIALLLPALLTAWPQQQALTAVIPEAPPAEALSAITIESSHTHMRYLSSDELAGRRTGSEGNNAAAAYIRDEALRLGLTPLPGEKDLFHPLEYVRITTLPGSSSVTLRDTLNRLLGSKGLVPLIPPAESQFLDGEVLFAGYGYVNSKEKYNDLAGVTVRDKIVMIMTRKPEPGGTGYPAEGSAIAEIDELRKLPALMLQQARAIVYVADPASGEEASASLLAMGSTYQLIPLFRKQQFIFSANVFAVTSATANAMLSNARVTLRQLQDSIASTRKPVSFTLPNLRAAITTVVAKDTVTSNNIIGYIEGSDPLLRDEAVIYIAHYDHVGTDASGNIHNGANDNASGSVGLLNIAAAYASLERKPARSAIFFWATGEEEGLHGSSYYTENPLFPLKKTVAVLNFDMIGRSRLDTDVGRSISGEIDITGRDTIRVIHGNDSPDLLTLALGACHESEIYPIDEGKGAHFTGSDHYPFFRKKIPVVFFFTGLHADYHRPTDDYEFIDFDKLIKVSRAGFLTGYRVSSLPGFRPGKK